MTKHQPPINDNARDPNADLKAAQRAVNAEARRRLEYSMLKTLERMRDGLPPVPEGVVLPGDAGR